MLHIPSWEDQQAMLARFDPYVGGGDWPGHSHSEVPSVKGNEALDYFFFQPFADKAGLQAKEAKQRTVPLYGKTARQQDAM